MLGFFTTLLKLSILSDSFNFFQYDSMAPQSVNIRVSPKKVVSHSLGEKQIEKLLPLANNKIYHLYLYLYGKFPQCIFQLT